MIALWTVFALLAASKPPPLDPPPEFVLPDVAAAQVKACGFANVSIKADETLQEEVIVVLGAAATDEQLRCAATASVSTEYFVQFPQALDERYRPIYSAISKERSVADAKAWLERRGLLAGLPHYEKGKTDVVQVAQKIETLCGLKAAGVLVPKGDFITFDMGTLDQPTLDDETMWCLINAASASGLPIGFVGNEYYSKDQR